ncbi:MAG TPA: aminotransferase class V-fold PLP-dependent enzyme [Streptosporangiaceae bacterium]|jgi:pyridoxal 5-phosphate dependent beta-lyase
MTETDVRSRQHSDGLTDPWLTWHDRRFPAEVLHLDAAAAGRGSTATLRAAAAHAQNEAARGVYVAEADASAVLEAGRADLAWLLGVPPDGLAFVEGATAALEVLLSAWPLRPGDTVAIAPSEWGPNVEAFGYHGLRVAALPSHDDGRVDLDALPAFLAATRPAFVHLVQVASHRPVVQPVAAAAAMCRAAGVPLWVDAAQALGHVDTALGADVLYATSRKWLAGPRGVGLLAVSDRYWDTLRPRSSALSRASVPAGSSAVRLLESHDANVAGRVGLCTAVREYLDTGPQLIWRRLSEIGALTREALAGLPGWDLLSSGGDVCAITALRPTAGQDVTEVRARLLAGHDILVTAEGTARAPHDMPTPLLRISPHVDCTPTDLTRLRTALESLT